MKRAVGIELSEAERSELKRIVGSSRSQFRYVQRARLVLLAAEGLANTEIAARLGVSTELVRRWRNRFAADRLDGLTDQPGRGRKRSYGPEKVGQIIHQTLTTTPSQATHWSTRSMAAQTGVSHSTVNRIWRAHRIKPHLVRTFKLSKDPAFAEKLRDVVGLYLNPPEHAVVLCVDEKSQIQALDRTQPGLPLKKGRCGTMTHDYKRHGTTTLFAALNVLEGTLMGTCKPRHRHSEYLQFLRQIDRTVPKSLEVHLIVDNYATHKHAKVKRWLARHKRFHVHFIPTSASWLNLIERFFSELTTQRIRRGVFRSVLELIGAIDDYLDAHNKAPKAFKWTKSADQILEKLAPLYNSLNNANCETVH